MDAVPPTSPRSRYREQTRNEIKQAALRQLADSGASGLALVKIAKELGMSGPALYRYFASRDDLLGALITDAYEDIATALTAVDLTGSPRAALHLLAETYRAWAVTQPHRYLLIEGTPVPGYTAPPQTLEHARAALGPFLTVFATGRPTPPVGPVIAEMRSWAERDAPVAAWVAGHLPAADLAAAGTALAGAVLAWSQLHGTVSLEVSGQYTGMGHSAATLLTAQTDLLADAFGLH
ncbi:TetR/AcrR family transcriptional regulator [Saccharothrix sp. ST-888]|uniref:TetR/AcrR family transcriptional regulator n=1 Tax=Saccharothrix sp. ST-888 TaxID=1427391 RepID=UPI0005EC86EA|nr:TetR/AcrR family transcriptional regulator [Saccharothrix sp. ST-888]KJK55573.1 TetR family transcriptional regulator [Saccharothrix sp. ST-888]